MKTKEVKLYVQAVKWMSQDEFKVEVSTYKRESCEYFVIVDLPEVTVDIEIPDVDAKQLDTEHIKQLEIQMQEEKDDSYVRVKAIEEKIQSLRVLEHIS